MTKYTLALIPLLMASTAMAEATDDGAKQLTQVFQTYLGTTEGVVSVAVDGEGYALTLDPSPLLAQAKEAGVTLAVSPLTYALVDNGDGTWAVTQDQAFSVTMSGPDKAEMKEDIARMTMEGTFDAGLMTFTTAKGNFEGLKMTSTQDSPEGQVTVEEGVEAGTYEMTGAAGASGGVDMSVTASATGISAVIAAPMGEGQPAMPINVKAESVSEKVTGSGVVLDGIYKTVAWVVAHPDDASKDAAKDELKGILTAALPVWGNLTIEGSVAKISADTMVGPVGLDEVTFTMDLNGAVPDGKFREAISASGLTLPPGIVPDWAAPILPQKVSIDVQASGFDAAAGIAAALDALDQTGMADQTALDAAVQKAFFPAGTFVLSINPSAITGDGYELTYQGDATMDVAKETGSGKALVTLTGADKLQAAIQNAPDDMKMQAMMGFGMAQGMAKQEGDKLIWEIDATDPTNPLINGAPVMGGQ